MVQRLDYLAETSSQTAGPYVHIGLAPRAAGFEIFETELGAVIAGPKTAGERVVIEGAVIDGTGAPVKDVLIEVWQANSHGRYRHPQDMRDLPLEDDFRGFGRIVPDFETGRFRIETVKPGPVPGPGGRSQAPHLTLWLIARGINIGLHTRLYFADEAEANAADPLLARVEQPARRETLIATGGGGRYSFDIHLQGDRETVFLDI
jgi:protocatechuate 3,4-dioxygenase alpha subunit